MSGLVSSLVLLPLTHPWAGRGCRRRRPTHPPFQHTHARARGPLADGGWWCTRGVAGFHDCFLSWLGALQGSMSVCLCVCPLPCFVMYRMPPSGCLCWRFETAVVALTFHWCPSCTVCSLIRDAIYLSGLQLLFKVIPLLILHLLRVHQPSYLSLKPPQPASPGLTNTPTGGVGQLEPYSEDDERPPFSTLAPSANSREATELS